MKAEITGLLTELEIKKEKTQTQQETLFREQIKLKQKRNQQARPVLAALLPDLKMSTVRNLERKFFSFTVPTVRHWFPLLRKVDPYYSINQLRIFLGVYMDKRGSFHWGQEIHDLDDKIREKEQALKTAAENLDDINQQIATLTKLLLIDLEKIDPAVKEKMAQAVRALGNGKSFVDLRPGTSPGSPPPYPTQRQIDSDNGPNLLAIWFWWQVLSPDSGYGQLASGIDSSPSLQTDNTTAPNLSTGETEQHHTLPESSTDTATTLEQHEALGSQSYS